MPSKSRNGLSVREYAKLNGNPAPTNKTKSKSSLEKYQKEYLNTLKPSKEEDAASTTLDNLVKSEALGVQNIEKQAILLTFIQGQSERLRNQATEQAIPLKLQLASLQSKRQANSEAASKKLSFATSKASKVEKTTDPLDTEYKTLRNARAQVSLSKARGGGKAVDKDKEAGWGPWKEKSVTDPEDPLGRRKITVSKRVNLKTGERQQK